MALRLKAEQRRLIIMNAAVKVANAQGLFGFTREDVAKACAVETGTMTVKNYWKTQDLLRREVAAHPDANDQVRSDAVAMGLVAA